MPTTAELIETYANGPKILRAAVSGMSREQILARPVAGKWSTLEVVVHLADFEPIIMERMKRIIFSTKPILFGADENEMVKTLAYHDRDLEEELQLIESVRATMTRVLKALPATAFTRQGIHSEKGLVTLEAILTGAGNHINHHLPFIHDKRKALGLA
jgi:uncharacterized damage-inducible protein DinB